MNLAHLYTTAFICSCDFPDRPDSNFSLSSKGMAASAAKVVGNGGVNVGDKPVHGCCEVGFSLLNASTI